MHDETQAIAEYAPALAAYKMEAGKKWQQQLRDDWLTDNRRQHGILRRLRNDRRFRDFDAIFVAFAKHEEALLVALLADFAEHDAEGGA